MQPAWEQTRNDSIADLKGTVMQHLTEARDYLRSQARQIRHTSAGLAGDALAATQEQHRALMARITQINDAIRNHQ